VESGTPLVIEMGKVIAFPIISPPLMLKDCHKPSFYFTKKGVWRDGSMSMPHYF